MTKDLPYYLLSAFILAAVVYANNAHSEIYLYAGAWSDHPFSDEGYNETHNLAAIEYNTLLVGYFRNSHKEDSIIVGHGVKRPVGHWEGSLLMGATYGYRNCFNGYADAHRRVCPAIVPMVSYTRWRVQPSVLMLGSAVAFTVRFEL